MMTYSQFTQYVELHIREYVSEEMMVSSKTWQQKNNGVPIEGLVFKDTGALVDMPVMVYFKDLYEKYIHHTMKCFIRNPHFDLYYLYSNTIQGLQEIHWIL